MILLKHQLTKLFTLCKIQSHTVNNMKPINILRGQSAEIIIISTGDTYIYHLVLKS
jgi:hypothetical protein